jgi:hypothetical protein
MAMSGRLEGAVACEHWLSQSKVGYLLNHKTTEYDVVGADKGTVWALGFRDCL